MYFCETVTIVKIVNKSIAPKFPCVPLQSLPQPVPILLSHSQVNT